MQANKWSRRKINVPLNIIFPLRHFYQPNKTFPETISSIQMKNSKKVLTYNFILFFFILITMIEKKISVVQNVFSDFGLKLEKINDSKQIILSGRTDYI